MPAICEKDGIAPFFVAACLQIQQAIRGEVFVPFESSLVDFWPNAFSGGSRSTLDETK